MDFSWSAEQVELRRSIVQFAQSELNDAVDQHDESGYFSREKWNKCAAFGLLGICFPREFGGQGHDALTAIAAMESLGYGCRDNGLIFSMNAQMWSVQTAIQHFGTREQQQRYLPKLISGELIGGHAMTEAGSGSDSSRLATQAVDDGDAYLVSGRKTFATNAPVADVLVLFAATNPAHGFLGITAFLVDRGTPGLVLSAPTRKLGLRTSPMCEVVLENCRLAKSCRLGPEGNGGVIFRHSMSWERCCILASCVGTMERQLELVVREARSRKRFGKPIASFQAVSHRIVDMKVRLEQARWLLYRAGWRRVQGDEALADVALAKLCISEAFVQSSLDAIQLFGGQGYTCDHEFERDLRDAVGSRIYAGTSEIQKGIIAQELGLG
jgi:alkylation response protein AidB-like acyl-CoA dehydrogenase